MTSEYGGGGVYGKKKLVLVCVCVGSVCMCVYRCTHPETHMHAPQRSWGDSDSPPSRPAALILLCYLNKVALWAIFFPAVHQSNSNPPTFPSFFTCRSSLFFCFSPLQWLSTHPPLPPANWSLLHCGGLLPHTVYDSSLKQSIKAMCYQKECCAAHGLHLDGGEVNFKLQHFFFWMWCKLYSCDVYGSHLKVQTTGSNMNNSMRPTAWGCFSLVGICPLVAMKGNII